MDGPLPKIQMFCRDFMTNDNNKKWSTLIFNFMDGINFSFLFSSCITIAFRKLQTITDA